MLTKQKIIKALSWLEDIIFFGLWIGLLLFSILIFIGSALPKDGTKFDQFFYGDILVMLAIGGGIFTYILPKFRQANLKAKCIFILVSIFLVGAWLNWGLPLFHYFIIPIN